MWEKLLIATVIAGGSTFAGYKLGIYHSQQALHDCQQARSQDQLRREQANAQRAISNADTIVRLRNERDAKVAQTRQIEQRAAQRNATLARELRERDAALVAALQVGHDCVVDPDAIRLLDDAAGNDPRLP